MSQETIQPHPEELVGLTPDQQQQAIDLREQEYAKALDVYELEHDQQQMRSLNEASGLPAGVSLIDIAQHAVAQHVANKAARRAARHYKKNEGAYQEQALKEASEAAKDINGWS